MSSLDNGGDGLICGRHLTHMGYKVEIVYPKRPDRKWFRDLTLQCEKLKIPVSNTFPNVADIDAKFQLVVDGIFGFSFAGDIRAPFKEIIQILAGLTVPVVSLDVPSGWDVDKGDTLGTRFSPAMLVSLGVPKPCAAHYRGAHHFLGGRFVPPELAQRYNLTVPTYPGAAQVVRLPGAPAGTKL